MFLLVGAIFLMASFFHYIYSRYLSPCGIPKSIPWIDAEDGRAFSRARITLQSMLHTHELVAKGYKKYSKRDLPFVLPNITTGPEVILPQSQMDWLLHQPDHKLSQSDVNRAFLQGEYTMLHPKVLSDTVHGDVIRKEMSKMIGDYVEGIRDEIDVTFRLNWGVNTEGWTKVTCYHSMLDIIARVSSRVLVGLPLCRNERYIESTKNFARLVVIEAAAISQLPEALKWLFSPLIRIYDVVNHYRNSKFIVPLIKERLSQTVEAEKQKHDYIQWCIDHSYNNNDSSQRSVDTINKRLSVLQFAAIQSSTITIANLLLDLAASPLNTLCLSAIRDEIAASLNGSHGEWTKSALSHMTVLDSTLHESMRLWGFVSRGVVKKVVAKNGVTLPSGHHLPCGTDVGVHASPIHRDEDIYPAAGEFKPWRFSGGDGGAATSLVTTSANFMAFSHGRHACPGRFFASQQLKLVVAYIALNYEIKAIPTRPENRWLVGSQGPPLDFEIEVRRRNGTA